MAEEEAMRRYADKLKMRVLLGVALSAVVLAAILGIIIMFLLIQKPSTVELQRYPTYKDPQYIGYPPGYPPPYSNWPHLPLQQHPSMNPGPRFSGQQLFKPEDNGLGIYRADSRPVLSPTRLQITSEQLPLGDSMQQNTTKEIVHRSRVMPTSHPQISTSERVFPTTDLAPLVMQPNQGTDYVATVQVIQQPTSNELSFSERMHWYTTEKLSDKYLREIYERNSTDEKMLSVTKYIQDIICPGPSECDPLWDSYQSLDGTCNNQENSNWGKANRCLKRILPANYADGVSKPRLNSASPTKVSMLLQSAKLSPLTTKPPRKLNLFLMAFMQFVTHDLSSTVASKTENTNCCSRLDLDECSLAINTSSDPFYAKKGVNCTNFVRSARCPCSEGRVREQLNSATPYLDLGPVYGRTLNDSLSLRDKNQTFLLATSEEGLPPYGGKHCIEPDKCFHGDSKMSQQHALTIIHVMFLRYHNRLALDLRSKYPDWSNDIIYLEARRMAIFHYQVIIFRELLPALIGEEACRCLGVHFEDLVNGTSYDSVNEAGIYNEFTTAVFRAHTLIPVSFGSIGIKYFDTENFKDNSYVAILLEELFRTQTSRGFPATESAVHQALDNRNTSFGLNMIALNVQRGRDHGLAPYVKYVEQRMKINITMWTDLIKYNVLPTERVRILRKIYSKVEDIDLFIGKDLETKPLPGVLGLTFEEIIAKQFREVAMRDRFFFSHTREDWTEAHRMSWKINMDKAWMSYVLCMAFPQEAKIIPRKTMFVLDDDNFSTCDQEQERWLGLIETEEDNY